MLNIIKNNIYYISNNNFFEVKVPKNKGKKEAKIYNIFKHKEKEKLKKLENNFILDCINPIKSKSKEYNDLNDESCMGYFYNKTSTHFLKRIGVMNRKGIVKKTQENEKGVGNDRMKVKPKEKFSLALISTLLPNSSILFHLS